MMKNSGRPPLQSPVASSYQIETLAEVLEAEPEMSKGSVASADTGYAPKSVLRDSGQIAPPGAKPIVTATSLRDEGALYFQVDVRGTCVARRNDNDFINGTTLLTVAGMTRGERDGILDAESTQHVVETGPPHLQGVW